MPKDGKITGRIAGAQKHDAQGGARLLEAKIVALIGDVW